MREELRDRELRRLYLSIFLVGIAMSVAFAVLALHLRAAAIPTETIGSLAAALAAGGVLISFVLGRTIRAFTAKRTLVAGLVGFACTITVLPLLASSGAIAVSRFLEGGSTIAIWVAYETLLLSRARPDRRGAVMSLYGISLALGYVVGPLVARGLLVFGRSSLPFFVAGGIALANALFVAAAVRRESRPPAVTGVPPPGATADGGLGSLSELAWRIKTSCFAMFSAGYLKASLVLFLPLYLVEHRAVVTSGPPLVLASYAAGSLVFGNVAARLGDRHGHLLLMRALAACGAFALLGFLVVDAFAAMCIVGALSGATLGAISPLGMALQGAIASRSEYGRATALSNGLYAAGTLVGPPITGLVYGVTKDLAIVQIALLWITFVVIGALSANDDPSRRRAQLA